MHAATLGAVLQVFVDVIVPVALVAALGGAVGRWRGVTVQPLSALVFYLFSPALVFDSLSRTELSADRAGRILVVIVASTVGLLMATTAWSTLRGHPRDLRSALALTVVAPNAGNMGLPVAALAFGDTGLQVAVVHLVGSSVIANTSGIAMASLAQGDPRRAIRAPFTYPFLYAALAGVAVRALGLELPAALAVPAASLADAAIPVMLVVLGLQLRNVLSTDDALDLGVSAALRLLAAPALTLAATIAVGLDGIDRDTLVVVAAMPTAVFTTIIAAEFETRTDFVTRAVITSTAAGIVTLTALITVLR